MFLITTGGIIAIIAVAIVVILVIWAIAITNKLRRLNEKVNESESGIDVALEKRFDQLTKLLDVTKGYAKHEVETLTQTIALRTGSIKESSTKEKSELAARLDAVEKGINVVVEKYPELKADKMFNNLQLSINDVEEHLQAARRLFNANVSELNQKIIVFPNSIIASMAHIQKREYFEATESKKEDVKMSF